jgi:hypothetical protein
MLKPEDIKQGVLVRTIHGGPILAILNREVPEFGQSSGERVFCQWWSYDYHRQVESFDVSTLRLATSAEDPNTEEEGFTIPTLPKPTPKKRENPFEPLLTTLSEIVQGLDIVHELKDGKVKVVSIDYGETPCPPTKRSHESVMQPVVTPDGETVMKSRLVASELSCNVARTLADEPDSLITEEQFYSIPGIGIRGLFNFVFGYQATPENVHLDCVHKGVSHHDNVVLAVREAIERHGLSESSSANAITDLIAYIDLHCPEDCDIVCHSKNGNPESS